MGRLTRRVTSAGGIGYGVNLWEMVPPGAVRAAGLAVVGMVADLPWGPVNTITEINSVAEFNAAFCPDPFDAAGDYSAMRALLNKQFPGGMLVCRIAPTSVARATAAKTFQDSAGTPANSVTVTAKYPGALGNSISVEWSVNEDDANARDATVTIGTTYEVTYEAVAVVSGGVLTVTDPGDPYVTFSKYSGATTAPAAVAATALTGGTDGTAQASDYVGSTSSSVGIRKFYADSVRVNVLFVAECPSGLIDTVNIGLKAFATEANKGMVVLCTPASQTEAQAKADVADYRDERIWYCYPRVKTIDGFSDDQDEITVDGNAFVAALIGLTDPWISPGGEYSSRFLKGITGLENEDITAAGYDQLNAAGIAPFRLVDSYGGAAISKAVTTSTTSGEEKVRVRRYKDYIGDSIAARMEFYVEKPLDLDYATRRLGPTTGALKGEIDSFLANEVQVNHASAAVADAWSSATESDIEAGRWTIQIRVRSYSDMDEIVLRPSVGDRVTVDA